VALRHDGVIAPAHPSKDTVSRWTRLLALGLFVALLLWLIDRTGLREQLTPTALRQLFAQHVVSGAVWFVLLFALANLAHIPGWPFMVAAVYALGPLGGYALTLTAAVLSCVVTFAWARWVGGTALADLGGARAQRWMGRMHRHPVKSVVMLRLMMQTLPTLNYALALTGLRFAPYLLGTLLGLPLPLAVFTLVVGGAFRWLGWS
jgi:uncharacterized membrane protein YdjX (TVP38/TMEM64 family)